MCESQGTQRDTLAKYGGLIKYLVLFSQSTCNDKKFGCTAQSSEGSSWCPTQHASAEGSYLSPQQQQIANSTTHASNVAEYLETSLDWGKLIDVDEDLYMKRLSAAMTEHA